MPAIPFPGLGRVDAIRSQDGRWVVVTSKGLIVAQLIDETSRPEALHRLFGDFPD